MVLFRRRKSNRGLMDKRESEQSRLRAWLAGRLGRKDIPDPVWEILEYRGHVQEALQEDTRGTLLVYAKALLPYAEVMESVAALPERSARKQREHYPDPPQHSEYELERPRILGEYVAVRAELDTRVQHLRERSLEQGRLLLPAEADEYLQWRRNKYPLEARRSTFPSPEVLEPLS